MKYLLLNILLIFTIYSLRAQGPPITGDKAIMLGEGTLIVKTLSRIVSTDIGSFSNVPLMLHYLPTSNSIFAIHFPYASSPDQKGFGDLSVRGKLQFYRKDQKGKTHRLAFKSVHWLPTGFDSGIPDISLGEYQTSLSLISGYETLKYGIGTEFGYRYIGGNYADFWIFNLGFGLPLLKQVYPANQLNLYFEYDSEWFNNGQKNIFFAQGIQYAKDQLTIEAAIQLPLVRNELSSIYTNHTWFLGARFVY